MSAISFGVVGRPKPVPIDRLRCRRLEEAVCGIIELVLGGPVR